MTSVEIPGIDFRNINAVKENFDVPTFCLDICVVERNQHIRQIDTVHLLIIVPYYLGTFYCNAPFLGTVPSFHFMHIIRIPISRILTHLLPYQPLIKTPELVSVLKLLLPVTYFLNSFSDGLLHP